MSRQKSILFVCTGNIFRSLSAEQCFKKYLADHSVTDWQVGSAGIIAAPQAIDPVVQETLRELDIPDFTHHQRHLTREILDSAEIVVGMAKNHIEYIEREFVYHHAVLFNELAVGEKTSVTDIEDDVLDYATNRPAVEEKIARTVREIHDKIPAVYARAVEICTACEVL